MSAECDARVGVKIWDLPTRLFHWVLALLILLQYGTAEWHWLSMQWHVRFGYAALALVAFRIAWGFAGSQTSRFADFVRGPARVARYLRDMFANREARSLGHNPLGGWSVLAMLACLAVQAISGLFASNHRHTEYGPLAARIPEAWTERLTTLHQINQNILLLLIGLHIAAVLLHWLVKDDDLVAPMLHGRKGIDAPAALRFAPAWRALLIFVVIALIVWGVVLWGRSP